MSSPLAGGTLFSTDADSFAGGIASLPSVAAKVLFYPSVDPAIRSGIHYLQPAEWLGLDRVT